MCAGDGKAGADHMGGLRRCLGCVEAQRARVARFRGPGQRLRLRSDGDDSDGQGAPQGGGGVQKNRLGPRSGSFAGFKGSRGQFHEKIGASFLYHPNRQNSSCFLSDVFSRLSVWREGETPQHKWSLGQRPC